MEKELEELQSILEENGTAVSKEELFTAGVFAKLDMLIEKVDVLSSRIRSLENALYGDSRVTTWLNMLQKK